MSNYQYDEKVTMKKKPKRRKLVTLKELRELRRGEKIAVERAAQEVTPKSQR